MRIMSYLFVALVVSAISALPAQSEQPNPLPVQPERPKPLPMGDKGTLIIADFDAWEEINNLGGLFGPWTRDPDNASQGCRIEITDDDRWGNSGLCLRMIYDVDSLTQAYNGMWLRLQEADFTPYNYLIVHVRGDREAGFSPRFKIELKNKAKGVGRHVITGITDQWQEFVIPLRRIKGLDKLDAMTEMVITFDDMRCAPKLGEILIDNIYLSK